MTDTATPCSDPLLSGLADDVLFEISVHLDRLARLGESQKIDLRSLPMSDADRQDLQQKLGRGEVMIEITAAGKSEIFETHFAGVWWVRHLGANDQAAVEYIDITTVPDILAADQVDIAAAARRMAESLEMTR